jgi:enoyl-CoA hydratase/carnithine racemase
MARPRGGDADSPVFQFMQALLDCEKPVVAAVTGAAIGIGTTHAGALRPRLRGRRCPPGDALRRRSVWCPSSASSLVMPQLMGTAKARPRSCCWATR